jgi:DNA-binding beta-propeller fold protein YncE
MGGSIQGLPTSPTGVVTTLAGSAASPVKAFVITTDGTNLYVADTNDNTIKIVTTTGAVTTLAGTALTVGHADGTGSAASFSNPNGITTDGTNLYVADTGNNTIRKIVIATRAVTTLAGTAGTPGHGDGTGPAAGFKSPYGITTDETNLYVADTGNNTVRKIVIATGAVTTLAGTAGISGHNDGSGPVASFSNPNGITTDGTNLYLTDTGNNAIRKVVVATGTVTTLAGTAGASGYSDGVGSVVRFNAPRGITMDGTKTNLYLADTGNNTIRKVVVATGAVTTLAGTTVTSGYSDGTGSKASFSSPYGITADGTNLYVADTNYNSIRRIVIDEGAVTTVTTLADSTPATLPGLSDGNGAIARFYQPFGITTDGTNLFVADYRNSIVRKIVIATGVVTTLPTGTLSFVAPTAITTDGTNLYVIDTGTNSILRIVIATGNLTPLVSYAAGLSHPYGITTDGTNIYVTDTRNQTIKKIVIATGVVTTLAGTAGTAGHADGKGTAASFSGPYGITTDGTNLYVADTGNNTVRRIVITTGEVTTLAGTAGIPGHADGKGTSASFSGPYGITADGTNLYVADTGNNTVRRIVIATGEVTTLTGTVGIPGHADGKGTSAGFSGPFGITTDGTSLYVADTGNNTIRKIQ